MLIKKENTIYSHNTFKPLETSGMFDPNMAKLDAEMIPKANSKVFKSKEFVLIEEEKLRETCKFETRLRKEKLFFGENAAWIMPDFQLNLRIPTHATKIQ